NDILSGGNGLSGDDILVGGAGNDLLNGGQGVDTMIGGTGNDMYIVDNAGDVVIEGLNAGVDRVHTLLSSYTLGANLENLSYAGTGAFHGIGNSLNNQITGGSGNDILSGGNGLGDDILIGGAGNDLLNGGQGVDTMIGGTGNDMYIVDNTGDVVIEGLNAGVDRVHTLLSNYTLGANLENLSYAGTGAFIGTGNTLANTITGGAGNDVLTGGAGNDTLIGGLGNDTFMFAAGFGNDRIMDFDANPAGGGQDLLNIAALGVTAANFAANVTIADVGADTLVSVGGGSIRLVGIADATTITQTDFILTV
ncbi:calcium-binding protein, partial [Pseudomonas borbori]